MEELSTGKVMIKFSIKFILWSILLLVIGAIILGAASSSGISEISESNMDNIDEIEEMFDVINKLVYGLVVIDVVVAFLSTILSTKGVAKKTKVTAENRKKYFKGIAIFLAIIAVLVIITHTVIVKTIDKLIVKEIDNADSIGELIELAEEESDELAKEFGIKAEDEFEDAVRLLKSLNTAGIVFSISGIAFACMIPISNIILKKKEV